jgi:catechol 2,3-dioxygenase-like lactoylglutathione lyase family enzyme
MSYSATIDVPDLEAGVAFYAGLFGFTETARPLPTLAVLDADGQSLLIFQKEPGSHPVKNALIARDYARHWTPVHLDFHIEDVKAMLPELARLGGTLEELHELPGRPTVAFCADPFGHGFCLIGKRRRQDVA